MSPAGPRSEVTIADSPAANGSPLRPARWHAAALACAGYAVAPHEYKVQADGKQWCTWHITPRPVIPQSDPVLAGGSAQLVNLLEPERDPNNLALVIGPSRMVRDYPQCPYLAAYHAARTLDILTAYVDRGGSPPVSVALTPGRGPLVRLMPAAASQDGNLAGIITDSYPIHISPSNPDLAAAMITLGFVFQRIVADGRLILCGPATSPDYDPVSVTCEGLKCSLAVQAFTAWGQHSEAASAQTLAAVAPPLRSPLPADHLLHWAAAGALRFLTIQALVARTTGHDSSALRSHIFKAKSQIPGHAVIATLDEYRDNQDNILKHLRR